MPTDPQYWSLVILQGITLAVLLVSWAGLLVPVFPGLLLMWLATLVYAILQQLAGRMDWIDWSLFGLITLLAICGGIVDNIIIASRMRGHDVPWRSIVLAMVAGLVAGIFFTPLAGIVAAPLSLYLAEASRLRDRQQGLQSAKRYLVAWGWAFGAVFSVGGLIVLLWMLWAFL